MIQIEAAYKHSLIVTLGCAAVLALAFAWVPSAEVWAGLTAADCVEYCERHTSCILPPAQRPAIQQPLNSWSNLAFVFVGALAAFRQPSPASWVFGLSCVVLGIGSFLFHASVTHAFQWLDVVGMYVAEAALVAWAVHRTWNVAYVPLLPAVIIADILLGVFKWQLNTTLVMVAMGVTIAGMMAVHVRDGRQSLGNALLPLLLLVVAYVIRALDVQKIVCAPESLLFQGHALWHFLCAGTLLSAFQFFAVVGEKRVRGVGAGLILLCLSLAGAGAVEAQVLQYVGAIRDSDGPFGLAGAHGLDISPDGRGVYVASFVDSALVVFARDQSGGMLSYVETHFDDVDGVRGLQSATSVALAPDGLDVYVASYFANALVGFRRDAATNGLTFNQVFVNDEVSGLSSPRWVTLSPDGSYVYVATFYDDSLVVFRRNPANGTLVHVQTLTHGVDGTAGLFRNSSVAASPDGASVYVCSEGGNAVSSFAKSEGVTPLVFTEAKVDGTAGVVDLVGPVSVTVSPDNSNVYVLTAKSLATFRRDTQTGSLDFVESSRDGISVDDRDSAPANIVLSRDGGLAFVTRSAEDGISIFRRATTSGHLNLIGEVVDGIDGVAGIVGAYDVAVSPDDSFIYVSGQFDDAIATFRVQPDFCAGDCDADGVVFIEELVAAVNVSAGTPRGSACPSGDIGNDSFVSFSELMQAIERSLRGC